MGILGIPQLGGQIFNQNVQNVKQLKSLELEDISGRVILMTMGKQPRIQDELKSELKQSHVKILKQSELMEVLGTNSVEKVKIHDLDEDEEYELFVDAVIII